MAIHRNQLLDAFKPSFKEHGFKKTGSNWHRDSSEIICVFNIQLSQWSERYYFNVGIWIKALDSPVRPGFPGCHVGSGLPLQSDNRNFNALADFENGFADVTTRVLELEKIIVPEALTWFATHDSSEKIQYQLEHLRHPGIGIPLAVLRHFHLPEPT